MDDLFEDWFHHDIQPRLKHPAIPARIYKKEINPVIGDMKISHVTSRDVREILRRIRESERPTIANNTLMYLKQIFRHAIKLDLTLNNPASAFVVKDAGGVEYSRERALTQEEIGQAFAIFRQHMNSFGFDNYLALCFYLVLGVRKGELTGAKWQEFDLEKAVWMIPEDRIKNRLSIAIPLPRQAIRWLQILKVHSFGSEYVLPSRKESNRPHIGSDTLNRAINKMFGIEQSRKKPNSSVMGEIAHFTVHDLRRTFRSQLSALGFSGAVGERAINHRLKGVEGIYDRYDYFTERREAHQKAADRIEPLVHFDGMN